MMYNVMLKFCWLYTKAANWWEPMDSGRRAERELGQACRTLQAPGIRRQRLCIFF